MNIIARREIINKLYISLFIIFGLGMILLGIFAAHLINTGYCFSKTRYVTDEEKINYGIAQILDEYPASVIEKSIEKGLASYSIPKNPIFYESIEKFKMENENCCTIHSYEKYLEGGRVNFLEKITGTATEVLEINYLVNFYDENNDKKSIMTRIFLPITSCGYKGTYQ